MICGKNGGIGKGDQEDIVIPERFPQRDVKLGIGKGDREQRLSEDSEGRSSPVRLGA